MALALEPVLLGIVVAPSWPGLALGVSAIAALLTRRPLHALGGSNTARHAFTILVACGAASASLAVWSAGPACLVPLLLALVPAGVFLHLDARRASRELTAEIAGGMAFAGFPAAIVLAGGASRELALVSAAFSFARALGSIVPLRVALRRRKGRQASTLSAWCASGVALGIGAVLSSVSETWVPFAWMLVFAARTALLISPASTRWRATRIGIAESILGLLAAITTGLAWHAISPV
jgi:hypothetical protein